MIRALSGACILEIAAVAAVVTVNCAVPAYGDEYRKLSGAEIKLLIAGKAVTDEVHYTDHFRAGGVYEGVFMNKRSTGTWKVKGAHLCITRSSQQEDCDELWRSGSKLQRRKAGLPNVRDNIIVLSE